MVRGKRKSKVQESFEKVLKEAQANPAIMKEVKAFTKASTKVTL